MNLPDNLKTGVKKIDELTQLIHDKNTPTNMLPYLEELRGIHMCSGEHSSSYESQYQKLIFKRDGGHVMPTFNLEDSIKFDERFTLQLWSWKHPSFFKKHLSTGEMVSDKRYYVVLKDVILGKTRFRSNDSYHSRFFDDETGSWINDGEPSMWCQEKLVTHLVWHLYELGGGQNTPLSFFQIVKEEFTDQKFRRTSYGEKYSWDNRHSHMFCNAGFSNTVLDFPKVEEFMP